MNTYKNVFKSYTVRVVRNEHWVYGAFVPWGRAFVPWGLALVPWGLALVPWGLALVPWG